MGINKKIAVICNYELLTHRVGGMDCFFWLFDKKCKANNIEVHWFFPNSSNNGDYKNFTLFESNYANVENYFLNHFANNQYDFVFTHFVELCTPFFWKFKKKSKAIVIAIDHNPRPLNGYTFQKKIEKKIKGILFSKYIDLFVGVSKYTVNEIVKDFGFQVKNKTLVIYNGVVLKDIQVSENRNEKYPKFLVASHLRPSKGIQDLIEAVHLLPNEIKSTITIDIYGDGIYKDTLLQKSKQYQLEKAINFKGSVSNLKEIYCQYDYLLQPTHMECFSLSIIESLAANIPVITTSVGGNKEVITHGLNGFIIAPKDINALKTILTNVFLGEQKIIDNTRITIENNFTIEKMVNNYINLVV
jgi:glycosyltransferase involved in cell wall biosynthesis